MLWAGHTQGLVDGDDWWCCAPTPGSLSSAMFSKISLLHSTAHSQQSPQCSPLHTQLKCYVNPFFVLSIARQKNAGDSDFWDIKYVYLSYLHVGIKATKTKHYNHGHKTCRIQIYEQIIFQRHVQTCKQNIYLSRATTINLKNKQSLIASWYRASLKKTFKEKYKTGIKEGVPIF